MADLDAAIEAAERAAFPGLPDGMSAGEAQRRTVAAVTAAAPLIRAAERAKIRAELLEWAANPASVWELIRSTVPGQVSNGEDHARATFVLHRVADRIAPEPSKEQR